MVLACVSDSAFQTKEPDCLALRGGIIALLEADQGRHVPGGACHVLEFYSRKQKRVTRSTFGAELHSLSECSELGMLLAGCVHEVIHGACTACKLAQLESTGSFGTSVFVFLDAESVFSAVTASEISVPTEANLLYPLKALREHLDAGRIRRVFWIDTRDMICDGLTKGSISRKALVLSFSSGQWRLAHEFKSWQSHLAPQVKAHS